MSLRSTTQLKNKANKIKRTNGEIIFDTCNTILLTIFGLLTLFPFWYVLVLSLNSGADSAYGGVMFWPREFTLDNYAYVLSFPQLKTAYFITIARTILGTTLHVLVCSLAAYSMSKKSMWGHKLFLTFFTIPMFVGGSLVSVYVVYSKLGLINNFLIYILPAAFSFFNMIVFRTFIYGLPTSLEESAKIDGAGYFRILFQIILPLCKPVIATLVLFAGVAHWLDFSTNLMFVYSKKLMTVQYLLYEVVRANRVTALTDSAMNQAGVAAMVNIKQITSQSVQMTVLMVATLPILFVYPFVQKHFAKGMMVGAIKG